MPKFGRKVYGYGRAYGARKAYSYKGSTVKRRRTASKKRVVRAVRSTKKFKSGSVRRSVAIARFRRRGVGGRVRRGASAIKMLRMFQKRNGSIGSRAPVDRYIVTSSTTAQTVDPDTSTQVYAAGWGWGSDIGFLLANIRTESPFTLVGGAYLYQPTLHVYGYSTIDFVSTGNIGIEVEIVECTPSRGRTGASTLAAIQTTFANSWAQSYDSVPTGYNLFPDTSILENTAFFEQQTVKFIPTKRLSIRVGVGKPRRIIFKYKTRTFRYAEYSQGTFLTEGQVGGKSFLYLFKVRGERGQVCGVESGVNKPILTELGTGFMIKQRDHYFYRWEAGNNRPTVYGSNIGANESVAEDALQWVGVPALKAQRFAAAADTSVGYVNWGGQDVNSKHEANINPIMDCTGDSFTPAVSTAP